MRNYLLLILFGITFLANSQSQQDISTQFNDPNLGDELLLPPDVMAFQKYNFISPNLYTGRVDVSIPIFQIQTGNIKIPISVSYNTGGIKVDDVASNVGLGWNLNAGGSVIRNVKDVDDRFKLEDFIPIPDDTEMGQGTIQPTIRYVGSFHMGNMTPEQYEQNAFYTGGYEVYKADSSPDIFMINAPGLNNRFILKPTNSNLNYFNATFLTKSDIRMTPTLLESMSYGYKYGFSGEEDGLADYDFPAPIFHDPEMRVRDKDFRSFRFNKNGIEYIFRTYEVKETRQIPLTLKPIDWTDGTRFVSSNYAIDISDWKLTTMYDKATKKTVVFQYEEYQRDSVLTVFNLKSTPPDIDMNSCYFDFNTYHLSLSETGETNNNISTIIKYPKLKRLQRIVWDEGTINFIYGLTREDAIGEKALTEIQVKDRLGNIIKRVVFNYSYFVSIEFNDNSIKSLKLDKVSILDTSGSQEQKYLLSYDESSPLPVRGWGTQDFLGYFNGYDSYTSGSTNFYPQKLFFYPNQGRYSYLPFAKTNATAQHIIDYPHAHHLEANTKSLIGILNKITYPTGGFSSFIYENHRFKFQGGEYTAGGARIKQQIINDGMGNQRKLNYSYLTASGGSSGEINNIPVFAYPTGSDFTKPIFFNKSKGGLELTNGAFVGYSRIIEEEVGNGFVEYKYSNTPNVPETRALAHNGYEVDCNSLLISNSAFPSLNYTDNSIRRGHLLSKKIFDNSNHLLIKNIYEYQYQIFETFPIENESKVYTEMSDGYSEASFFRVNTSSVLNTERNLLKKEIQTEYFNGLAKTVTKEYLYDTEHPFIKESKTIDALSTIKTKVYYPFDSEVSSDLFMSNLIEENRIGEPILLKIYKNDNLVSTKKINYDDFNDHFGNKIISKKSISVAKGALPLEDNLIIDLIDNLKGNLKEYHIIGGKHTVLIWGYNHTKPVAKIVGVTYNQLPATQLNAINNFNYDTGTEANLITKLNALRAALPNAQVSTFTYKPLIGVSTMTDAKGQQVNYYYDSFNRLKFVKDAQGHILKENEYHFRLN